MNEQPTPPSAGEGELEQLLANGMKTIIAAAVRGDDTAGKLAGDDLVAAINAYIARRVLEVIGEDEHYAPDDPRRRLTGEPFEWAERNALRAEQRQRIAVIKKESQQ